MGPEVAERLEFRVLGPLEVECPRVRGHLRGFVETGWRLDDALAADRRDRERAQQRRSDVIWPRHADQFDPADTIRKQASDRLDDGERDSGVADSSRTGDCHQASVRGEKKALMSCSSGARPSIGAVGRGTAAPCGKPIGPPSRQTNVIAGQPAHRQGGCLFEYLALTSFELTRR